MSQSRCSAIINQGIKKGTQCSRPIKENSVCGKHISYFKLKSSIDNGNIKCFTHRCLNTFVATSDKKMQYCNECIEKKEIKLSTMNLCEWKESQCKSKAKTNGFCGKHFTRGILLKESSENKQKICDNGKRSCKNIIITDKTKCEECLIKNRIKDNKVYNSRKEMNMCTQCGILIESLLDGIRNNNIQKCKDCYEKTLKIEDERIRNRNYLSEKKQKPQRHYRVYIESACKRNIKFELDLNAFIELVSKPCYYCEYYSDIEVIGIDRIDSSLGYTPINCVPCCETCNMMKGELSIDAFKQHICKLASVFNKKSLNTIVHSKNIDNEANGESYIRPSKIVEFYIRDKLQEFINLCIKDNRSPMFINKLKELLVKTPKLTADALKKYIKNILFTESRLIHLTDVKERKRIPRKEIMGYLEANNIKAIITIYENTFGYEKDLESDFTHLGNIWSSLSESERVIQLEKIIIKYQNKRASKKS